MINFDQCSRSNKFKGIANLQIKVQIVEKVNPQKLFQKVNDQR
jgi:hypothetical protein